MPRRYPSTIGGLCYLAVLALALGALIVVATGHWRLGVDLLAGSLLCAALARLVLRTEDAGMLEVRSKLFDVTLLLVGGGLMIWLASTVPAAG